MTVGVSVCERLLLLLLLLRDARGERGERERETACVHVGMPGNRVESRRINQPDIIFKK